MRSFTASQATFPHDLMAFLATRNQGNTDDALPTTVRDILRNVQQHGNAAIQEYTTRFDHYDWNGQPLTANFITEQAAKCEPAVREALQFAATRIERFHQLQQPQHIAHEQDGISSGLRWQAISAAGLYVPGGRASYPSSVLMNAIPAKVAGVERIAMVVPLPGGQANPAVFAAAQIAGVTEIYPIGGAQAVAALAYGTETVKAVDKIVGPGNAFVAEAKRQVFGTVGIDSIAGPSEILVVADSTANPHWLAWDLLSQAEHDPTAQSILISDDADIIQQTVHEIENILKTLPRQKIAQESIDTFGATILVDNLATEAPAIINQIAPEHLELCIANPQSLFNQVTAAGSVFLGHHTPEAIGDYTGGPNHVLPTMGTARFASGLSVYDFLTRTTYLEVSESAFPMIAKPTITLADAEGLTAHAGSARCRLK